MRALVRRGAVDGAWAKLARKLAVLCIVLLVAVSGLSVALVALSRNARTVGCVNRILAARNGTSAADSAAHIQFAQALDALLQAGLTPAETQRRLVQFRGVAHTYEVTLEADQAFRAAHPLGRC